MPVYDIPVITNDQSLDRVLNAGLPVALVLWDGHANPRGLEDDLNTALKDLAHAQAGKLLVARVDVADNPDAARRWPGSPLPAIVALKDGDSAGPAGPLTPALLKPYTDYLLGTGARPQPQTAPANGGSTNGAHAASGAPAADPALTHPVKVTDATFQQEVLDSRVPVVVDFWAPWCGPCRMIAPSLEKIAAEMGGRVKIAKVNVDENQRYAGQYGVQGIPTLLLVRDGKIADRLVGALPEPALRQRIQGFVR